MTQYIDFLPESHCNKRQRKRTMRWRQAVVIVFLLIVVAGGARQHQDRKSLQVERDKLAKQADAMNQQLTDPAELRQRIAELDREAELATQLRLRTPPTRVLASITGSLPQFVSLTEYRAGYFNPDSSGKSSAPTKAKKKDARPAGSPVERDLARLRAEQREHPLIVTIKGLAVDDLSISQFLGRLQKCDTFDEVRLMYTDTAEFNRHTMRGFKIRLQVRGITAKRSPALTHRAAQPRRVDDRRQQGGLRT